MNYFFSVEMIDMIQRECPDIYVIFAGGDDLFFLGPWAKLLDFGQQLRQRFQQYTANNPDITLSAGIGIFRSKMPIRSIADKAEELLSEAKGRKLDKELLKNGVSLFGDVVSWDELDSQINRGKELEKLIDSNVLPSGLANRLLHYSRQKRKFMKNHQMRDLLYRSHMSYDFARNLSEQQFTRNSFTREDYQRFVSGWTGSDEAWLEKAEIPLHYALYRVRS
jgi:CRISPR-associated protein Csm1